MLKIHEPTLTLMFKGSALKQQVLEEALSTLQPRPRAVRFGQNSGSNPWPGVAPPSSLFDTDLALRAKQQAVDAERAQFEADMKALDAQGKAAAKTAAPAKQKD